MSAARVVYPSDLVAKAHLRAGLRRDEALSGPLLDFVPAISPRFGAPRHLAAIAAQWERVETEGHVRVLVSVPPRHGKTELLLHGFAWLLRRQPWRTLAYVTYQAELAESKARMAHTYIRRAGCHIVRDALYEMRLEQGGGMFATGIGGPLTGQGVDALVIDDPFKDRQAADSLLQRDRVYQWFQGVANTRVEPTGATFVVHTRWHQDDLIGRLEEEGGWTVINLPAIDDHGRALWPARWPVEALESKRKVSGEYEWSSLYQGRPRPRGARLFEREAPRFDPGEKLTGWRIFIGADVAASEKTWADYSAIVVLAARYRPRWRGDELLPPKPEDLEIRILEVHRLQVTIPVFVRRLLEVTRKHGAPCIVEQNNVGRAVPQILREIDANLRIIGVDAIADKFTRAQPLSAAWADGRVSVPAPANDTTPAPSWLVDYLAELSAFTGVRDRHDDQADATAHAYNFAAANLTADRAETRNTTPRAMSSGGGF